MANVVAKIKWFDPRKGYGFATTDDGQDIFVHHSAVESGRVYLGFRPGDKIVCKTEEGEKGVHATHVNLQEAKPSKP